MSSKRQYAGAARVIEVAPPGIPFRAMLNVDHITAIVFQHKTEKVPVPDDSIEGTPAQFDDDGNEIAPAQPGMRMDERLTGFMVIIGLGDQRNEFTFGNPQQAIDFYYDMHARISAVGVPCAMQKGKMAIMPPPEPEEEEEEEEEEPTIDELIDEMTEEVEAETKPN